MGKKGEAKKARARFAELKKKEEKEGGMAYGPP